MSNINLADVIVSYEGQKLPAINLLNKLQKQLQEAACQMDAIANTLGDLQAALLNSTTVEVKLTLSREDLDRFRSLTGRDDSDRIRKAVMNLLHPEGSAAAVSALDPVAASKAAEEKTTGSPEAINSANHEPFMPPVLEPVPQTLPGQPTIPEAAARKRTTVCPRCQSLIDLPELSNEHWSFEIKCGSCETKYLVKSQMHTD